jgi:hypothetical protein
MLQNSGRKEVVGIRFLLQGESDNDAKENLVLNVCKAVFFFFFLRTELLQEMVLSHIFISLFIYLFIYLLFNLCVSRCMCGTMHISPLSEEVTARVGFLLQHLEHES